MKECDDVERAARGMRRVDRVADARAWSEARVFVVVVILESPSV